MQGISYQYEKTDTNDKIKVMVTYPEEDAAQERLLYEVKSMMETIIIQQINEKP